MKSSLYSSFLEVAKSFSSNNAISDKNEDLTYQQFLNRIDFYQTKIDASKNTCAVIYLPKCIDMVAIQLALNAKEVAFLTLEWNQENRKNECIEKVKPSIFITLINNKIELINLENYSIYPEDIGYIVFSSGSTGNPKQIWMKSTPVIEVVKQQAEITSFTDKNVFLWLLNSAFDASLSDIYLTLLSGGHLIITELNALNTKKIFQLIEKYQVTHTDIPPVVFSVWLKSFQQKKISLSLNHIIFGGELANEAVAKEMLHFVNLYNAYGPTETTICSSLRKLDNSWSNNNVGTPLIGVYYKITNDELHIGGNHCAIGYDSDILNQKFYIENDIKWFKTGDIFKEQNGEFYYVGRKDRQFKFNGQLICPEEIENKAKLAGAENSQLVFSENKMTLYYSGNLNKELFEKTIVSWMKPQIYKHIQNIENNLNQNWKLKINE